jgi:hypothetical protein
MPSGSNKPSGPLSDSQSVQLAPASLLSDQMSANPTAGALVVRRPGLFKTRVLSDDTKLATLVKVGDSIVGGTFNRAKAVNPATSALVLDAEALGLLRIAAYNLRCPNPEAIDNLAALVVKTPDVLKCITAAKMSKGKKQTIYGIHAGKSVDGTYENAKAKRDACHVWPLPVSFVKAIAALAVPDDHELKWIHNNISSLNVDTYNEDRSALLTFENEGALTNIDLDKTYNKMNDSNKTEGIAPVAKTVEKKRKLENLEKECDNLKKKASFVSSVVELGNGAVALALNLTEGQVVMDPNGNVLVTGRVVKTESEGAAAEPEGAADAAMDDEEEDEEDDV